MTTRTWSRSQKVNLLHAGFEHSDWTFNICQPIRARQSPNQEANFTHGLYFIGLGPRLMCVEAIVSAFDGKFSLEILRTPI